MHISNNSFKVRRNKFPLIAIARTLMAPGGNKVVIHIALQIKKVRYCRQIRVKVVWRKNMSHADGASSKQNNKQME